MAKLGFEYALNSGVTLLLHQSWGIQRVTPPLQEVDRGGWPVSYFQRHSSLRHSPKPQALPWDGSHYSLPEDLTS